MTIRLHLRNTLDKVSLTEQEVKRFSGNRVRIFEILQVLFINMAME